MGFSLIWLIIWSKNTGELSCFAWLVIMEWKTVIASLLVYDIDLPFYKLFVDVDKNMELKSSIGLFTDMFADYRFKLIEIFYHWHRQLLWNWNKPSFTSVSLTVLVITEFINKNYTTSFPQTRLIYNCEIYKKKQNKKKQRFSPSLLIITEMESFFNIILIWLLMWSKTCDRLLTDHWWWNDKQALGWHGWLYRNDPWFLFFVKFTLLAVSLALYDQYCVGAP